MMPFHATRNSNGLSLNLRVLANFFQLQDHERIRGGLYFIQAIPRDENWKVRRDVLAVFEPKKAEDCELNVSAELPDQQQPSLAQQVCLFLTEEAYNHNGL
jgi:hypothetical protein